MKPTHWVLLGLTLCVVSVAALFTVQNSGRTTDLSLDLYFWAWHLERDVAVPYLLWGTLGGGFLFGAIAGRVSGRGTSASRSYTAPTSSGYGTAPVSDDDWT